MSAERVESMRVGAVVIGRNEGERLARCLASLPPELSPVVYVDSGSTDGSVERAAAAGAKVVVLDSSKPFSAARARNEGFEALRAASPNVEAVQFVDGDCEMSPGWLGRALETLRTDPGVAIVCGRVRERARNATVYNRLCDMEFNRLPGEVRACGGIFLSRASAFAAVGGFDPGVVAGEEPEMCLRLRSAGHRIVRLPDDMCLHDSAMTRFGQWWKRCQRSGYAYALAAAMHGSGPDRHGVRELRSIWMWTVGLPLAGLVGAALAVAWWPVVAASVLAVYAAQAARIAWGRRGLGERIGDRVLLGAATMVGKFAQLAGTIRYWRERERPRLIEYKDVPAGGVREARPSVP